MKSLIAELVDSILRYICILELKPEAPLPSIRFFSDCFKVTSYQINSALQWLEKKGIIYKQQQRGYFLQSPPEVKYEKRICRLLIIGNFSETGFSLAESLHTRHYFRLAEIYNLEAEVANTMNSEKKERWVLQSILQDERTAAIFIKATFPGNSDLVYEAIRRKKKWLFIAGRPPYEQIVPYLGTDDFMIGGCAGNLLASCRQTVNTLYLGYCPDNDQMSSSRRQGVLTKLIKNPAEKVDELLFADRCPGNLERLQIFMQKKQKLRYKVFAASRYFTDLILEALPDWEINRDYYLIGMDYDKPVNGLVLTGINRHKELEAKLAMDWILKVPVNWNIMQIFLKPIVQIGESIKLGE